MRRISLKTPTPEEQKAHLAAIALAKQSYCAGAVLVMNHDFSIITSIDHEQGRSNDCIFFNQILEVPGSAPYKPCHIFEDVKYWNLAGFTVGYLIQPQPFFYVSFYNYEIKRTNIDWVELRFDGAGEFPDRTDKMHYKLFYDEDIGHRMDLIQRFFATKVACSHFKLHKCKVVRRMRWEREVIQCLITTRIIRNNKEKYTLNSKVVLHDIVREILHQLYPTIIDSQLQRIMAMVEYELSLATKQEYLAYVRQQ